jgi:hypothetical protein
MVRFGVPRSTPKARSGYPAIRRRRAPAALPGIISGLPIKEWGSDERIERSPSKLIFFLTIDNSPALNGPVATQVKTGESMHRSASGSSRPMPSWRLVSMRGYGGSLAFFRVAEAREHARKGETKPVLKCQNRHRMQNQPASFLPDGEATVRRKQPQQHF